MHYWVHVTIIANVGDSIANLKFILYRRFCNHSPSIIHVWLNLFFLFSFIRMLIFFATNLVHNNIILNRLATLVWIIGKQIYYYFNFFYHLCLFLLNLIYDSLSNFRKSFSHNLILLCVVFIIHLIFWLCLSFTIWW